MGDFQHYILNDDFQFGFIAPGHVSRGRQVSLKTNSDLEKMYDEHKKRREVVLWLKVVKEQRKRPLSNSAVINIEFKTKRPNVEQGSSRGSNYQGHLKHFSDIQCIVEKLEKMHAGDYSPEQLRAWAHMIDMKKHSSYDTPPHKPFFKRAVSGTKELCMSPGKRIKYRSECIDQLDKWHALLEKGDFFSVDPSKDCISGINVPLTKSAKISPLTEPWVSSTPTKPSLDMAVIADTLLPRISIRS